MHRSSNDLLTLGLTTIEPNLRYILDTIAESDIEEERWKGVTTLQLLTRNGIIFHVAVITIRTLFLESERITF